MAKPSHHKAFLETCLPRNSPPRNMLVWIKPQDNHYSTRIEQQWNDILKKASRDLTTALIQHYNEVIQCEKDTGRKQSLIPLHRSTQKGPGNRTWRELTKKAEDEAK